MLQEEKTIIKVSLILSLVGIGILLFMQKSQIVSATPISSINSSLLNQNIMISGKISSIKESPSVQMLKVSEGNESITVVAFRSDIIDVSKGDYIKVEGKVMKYKEDFEVEAKTIQVL